MSNTHSPRHVNWHRFFHPSLFVFVLLASGFGITSCTVLLGNVRPSAEKSNAYSIMDLSKKNPSWQKLDPFEIGRDTNVRESTKTEVSDVTYQSKSTQSIISMNSTCHDAEIREKRLRGIPSLEEHTRTLLLGISANASPQQELLRINDLEALQTTLQGELERRDVKVRSVVFENDDCVYDFMFMSKPEFFERDKDLFADFARSFSQ